MNQPQDETGKSSTSQQTPPTRSPSAATTESTVNSASPAKTAEAKSSITSLFEDIVRVPKSYISDVKAKLSNLPRTNYELGIQLQEAGELRDAILRFSVARWLAPNFQLAWFRLGSCYLSVGERDKAKTALKQAYRLNPNHEETCFLLTSLDPSLVPAEKQPQTMPASIAIDYFDRAAPQYDSDQRQQRYRGHQYAEQGLYNYIDIKRVDYNLLDLGCGTGLVGAVMSKYCQHIVGVDFSRNMLQQAMRRRRDDDSRIYRQVMHQDIHYYLADNDQEFELITAVHVFNYIGDLQNIIPHIASKLAPGGLFLFQVEPFTQNEGFGLLQDYARFGHSRTYIKDLLKQSNLTIKYDDLIPVYPNYNLRQYVVTAPHE
jgi:predicted TPR repeat methyltransferase